MTRLCDSIVRQRSLYLVKLTNIPDHIFPEVKPFFKEHFSATSIFILEKHSTPERISAIPDEDYGTIRCISHRKLSYAKLISLKKLDTNTIEESNLIFETQLTSMPTLYKTADAEVFQIENEIIPLVEELNPRIFTILGIGVIIDAVIASEYGNFNRFPSVSQMLFLPD